MEENKEIIKDVRLQNLELGKWKKGESGNPEGRPKKEFSMTQAMRDILNEPDPKTKVERYKNVLRVAIEKAEGGDNDMIKYIVNRLEGMPAGSSPTIPIENLENLVIVVRE